MRLTAAVLVVLLAGCCLAACGERSQSLDHAKRATDTPAWQSDNKSYDAPGYVPGDKAKWDAQLARRAQGQNDYAPRQ